MNAILSLISSPCEVAVGAQCFAPTLVCRVFRRLEALGYDSGMYASLHVMGVAAQRSVCSRRNTTGRTRTSGKPGCLAALASIFPADCSSVPLSAASRPRPLSSSPPLWSYLHVSRAHCVAGLVLEAPSPCLDQLIIRSINNWTCSGMWFILSQPLATGIRWQINIGVYMNSLFSWVRGYIGVC